MTDSVIKTPDHILLATDLSPRCDRAVARAVQLAAKWNAGIVAVHCLGKTASIEAEMLPDFAPWRSGPEARRMGERQLAKDLAAFGGSGDIVVEEGDAAEIIHSVAEERGCGLIVTGPATKESFWTSILGTTTDQLLRLSPRPVLIVRARAETPYRDIVVATDFSSSSRTAFQTATRLFPEWRPTLFHAYRAPYERMAAEPGSYLALARKAAEEECAAFLAAMGDAAATVALEHGEPEVALRRRLTDVDDLVVVGRGSHHVVTEFLLGSTARKILDTLGCDCLVAGPPADTET